MEKVIVAYVPVLHAGYIKFFKNHPEAESLYLLSKESIKDSPFFHKEIRGLNEEDAKQSITSLGLFKEVKIINPQNLSELEGKQVISPREKISEEFIENNLSGYDVVFDDIFLRWDEGSVKKEHGINVDRESSDELDLEMITRAEAEANKSSDWWRHVGAVAVKDGKVILENHNQPTPSEHQPYVDGDPRDVIVAGKDPELTAVLHAEQGLITEAAREGVSLEGASLYLTTFPCNMCAKLVAYSGVKKVFFKEGSAVLDGERILKAKNIELIRVKQKSREA